VSVSYKTHDPKGWCGDPTRGAALGRPSIQGSRDYAGRFVLRRIRLDTGGYDSNGTYFGEGQPLYWYASADGSIDRMLRADSRAAAKAAVLEKYPHATFSR
jgi:hypothetical protein